MECSGLNFIDPSLIKIIERSMWIRVMPAKDLDIDFNVSDTFPVKEPSLEV
jgi:hypothetical protein